MPRETRAYTRRLLQAVEDGVLDRDTVLLAALNHMSEQEVHDMCDSNDFFPQDEDEDEDEDADPLDNFNWVGSRHHY